MTEDSDKRLILTPHALKMARSMVLSECKQPVIINEKIIPNASTERTLAEKASAYRFDKPEKCTPKKLEVNKKVDEKWNDGKMDPFLTTYYRKVAKAEKEKREKEEKRSSEVKTLQNAKQVL